MKTIYFISILIFVVSSRILDKKKPNLKSKTVALKKVVKNASKRPERKLYYYVDAPSKSSKDQNDKRKLEQKNTDKNPQKLHLNKSFVVSSKQMEHLRKLKQTGKTENALNKNKISPKARSLEQGSHEAGQGEDLENDESGHSKLQSTPLLLIGNYEIIVEKKDED